MNPRPCNAAILTNEKGEILLVRRKYAPWRGYWDLPGGFVDLYESLEESLVRELQEELSITIHEFSYFTSSGDTYRYKGIVYPTLGLIFTGCIRNQKVREGDDVSEVQFFAQDKLPFSRIAFKSIREALRKFVAVSSNSHK